MPDKDFLQRLSAFIASNDLFSKKDVLLCAVSGGLDSMVLAEALQQLNYQLEIAHVHYGLRGKDSDLDAVLVQNWAARQGIPFHLKKAKDLLDNMPGSLQEKARNIRYEWLESLAAERGIGHLLLAHHSDDWSETILLQFFRGAGVQGLSALQPSSGIRRRPLLGFTKTELNAFALEQKIEWREDASNAGDAYLRNRLRHKLLPVLEELFQGYEKVIQRNSARMKSSADALNYLFEDLYGAFLEEENVFRAAFRLDNISRHPMGKFFIAELLLRNGFHFSDAMNLSEEPGKTEGRSRKNTEGICLEMRYPKMLLWKRQPPVLEQVLIEKPGLFRKELADGRILRIWLEEAEMEWEGLEIWKVPLAQIQFPLCLRPWQAGDRMAVAGMGGRRKKLSDVFTECGFTELEKSQQFVLEDASNRILWIPGVRTSEPSRSGSPDGPPYVWFGI